MSDTSDAADLAELLTGEAAASDLLRLVTCGSVDDGKSTLIGRLLFDTKQVFVDQMEAVEETSERRGDGYVNLALLTDGLRADQVRRRAHAGMMQLHVCDAARGLDARCEPRQTGQVRVRPAAELAGKALSLRLHVRCAGQRGAEAALRAQREPVVFVVRERPVDVALQVGERRQHEAVLQAGAACHRNRVEQGSHGGGHLRAD